MKYYGMIYVGNIDIYNKKKENTKAYDSPYDALLQANIDWNRKEAVEGHRFFIILQDGAEKHNAYFQFTDNSACEKFIRDKKHIIWSSPEEQVWNGNACAMT